MRGVSSCRVAFVALLLFLFVAVPAMATDSGSDSGLWPQFVAWLDGRIGIPIGVTFDEWLVLMGRIGIPIG